MRRSTAPLFVLLALVVLCPASAFAQACTYYASATGSGSACTNGSPCLINSWWGLAAPGVTLCLKDGTYTGANSMIVAPAGVAGTAGNPVTIRAENDGGVLIDAQNVRRGLYLSYHGGGANDNQYIVVEGINFTNGSDGLLLIAGSNSIGKRLIGWNGTTGEADSNIFRAIGYNSRFEDCAGWGMNSRKIFDGAQEGNLQTAGFRRCWGEWNDHTGHTTTPNNTYQMGYNTTNQLFENVLGTWDTLGTDAEPQGVFDLFCGESPCSMEGAQLLGSIFYIRAASSFPATQLMLVGGIFDMLIKDTVSFVAPGFSSVRPMQLTTNNNNTCDNCLSIHAGTVSIRADWSTPNWREGNGLAAATGGTSPFVLLPGLCTRYVDGVLTSTPLWPWPMDARIAAARAAGGFRTTNVTAEIESLLGTIPTACRSDVAGHSGEVTVSPTTINIGGSVTATWANVTMPDPYQWIGLYAAGAANTAYLAFQYTDPTHTAGTANGNMAFTIPSTGLTPGTYELRLFNDDTFGLFLDASPALTITADTITFLSEVTGLGVSGNSTVTFLGEASGLGVSGNSTVPFLSEVTGLGVSGNSTVPFLSEVTGLGVE